MTLEQQNQLKQSKENLWLIDLCCSMGSNQCPEPQHGNYKLQELNITKYTNQDLFHFDDAEYLVKASRTVFFVGSAGIAPLSVTVRAPQAFAKSKASLNRSSSCQKDKFTCMFLRKKWYQNNKILVCKPQILNTLSTSPLKVI